MNHRHSPLHLPPFPPPSGISRRFLVQVLVGEFRLKFRLRLCIMAADPMRCVPPQSNLPRKDPCDGAACRVTFVTLQATVCMNSQVQPRLVARMFELLANDPAAPR